MEQLLYLGVDFWKAFEIAPNILAAEEISILQMEIHGERNNSKTHELFPYQQKELQDVKMFLTFEKHAKKLVEGAVPVKEKHYPLYPALQEIVYNELEKMLALKVVEESEGPWSNRTTVVGKPAKNRFCFDARKFNAVIIKDAYPLQNIDGIYKYKSSVDWKYALWQIAFTVPGRPLYQFRVMPFGLCNAAQRLCRLMD